MIPFIYSNWANITSSKHEFSIEFGTMVPNLEQSEGDMIVKPQYQPGFKTFHSPSHFKSLVKAMTDNLKKYEESFGEIDISDVKIKE